MSKSFLFDPRSQSFLDFIGNGKRYVVPPYQRDYSWSEEQWEDLWNDILEIRGNRDDRHYMGALVVQAKSDREYVVIDGQQRLVTLSILALVIISRLRELANNGKEPSENQERAATLRTRFIGEKDAASLIEVSKLTLNNSDNGFYQDYLVQDRSPINPRRLPKSNRQIWDCSQWFRKKLVQLGGDNPSGHVLATLLSETIARQLLFIVITVDDEMNAYTVFETLNARGLELSATDLLKNYLFSRIKSPSDLLSLQRRWQDLITVVKQEKFPEFLRYHLLCYQAKVRSNSLFKTIRERVRVPEDVFSLVDQLENRAELYTALTDSTHEYWIERPKCRQLIRERILLRSHQSVPLLFAAWERFSELDFERTLRLMNVFTFRFITVSGLNQNELEPLFHFSAKSVLEGLADNVSKVFDAIKSAYVDDDRFRRNFEVFEIESRGQAKTLAKYVLCRFEADRSGKDIDYETDTGTIEHILPENPEAIWESSIPVEGWPKCVYRIGNLTLLEPGKNREIGNESYERKIAVYPSSRYQITKDIVGRSNEEWTIAQIELRQGDLAKRATHLWRVDFS